ncbi:hypothetical protein ACLOJK_017864 [Asimina triloba]
MGLPLSLLKTAQGHPMLVELKNGETYNGHLVNCDTWMNIHLREVICTSKDGDRFWRMPECYIRGNTIKYLRVPDEIGNHLAWAVEEEEVGRIAAVAGQLKALDVVMMGVKEWEVGGARVVQAAKAVVVEVEDGAVADYTSLQSEQTTFLIHCSASITSYGGCKFSSVLIGYGIDILLD